MNSFNQTIRFQDVEHSAFPGIDERAIVASTKNHAPTRAQIRQELFEQPVLTDISQFHGCWTSSGKASAVNVIALKSACIVMETRIEPLHS